MQENSLALVLSGGSVRAAAHVGVLKALAEYNINFDLVVGTSGGAIVAALYGRGTTISQIEKVFLSFQDRGDQIIDLNWRGLWNVVVHKDYRRLSGLVRGDALQRIMEEHLGKGRSFAHLPKQLLIPAVNLSNGKQTIFCDPKRLPVSLKNEKYLNFRISSEAQVADAVRASCSIPGVFTPVQVGAEYYVDGGVRNGYPLSVAVKLGQAHCVLGVNLGYAGMRREQVAESGLGEILTQSLDIIMRGQYRDSLNDQAIKDSRIITLNPLLFDIGTFEVEYIPEMIERGYKVAKLLCQEKGLHITNSAESNKKLLFQNVDSPVKFPAPKSALCNNFLNKQLKTGSGLKETPFIPGEYVERIFRNLELACAGLIFTLLLASTGLVIWVFKQTNWVAGIAVICSILATIWIVVRKIQHI